MSDPNKSTAGGKRKAGWLQKVDDEQKQEEEKTATKQAIQRKEFEAELEENKTKLLKIIQWEVIDEKHSSVAKAKETLTTLLTLCDNVVKNPQDGRYRKVKARNTLLKRSVLDAPGGQNCLMALGWESKVAEFERHWVLECLPGGYDWKKFKAQVAVLREQMGKLEEKAAYQERVKRDAKLGGEQLREQVLAAIKDDAEQRKVKFVYNKCVF